MQVQAIACQRCGAPLDVRDALDSVQCSHCSSVHSIERPTPMQIIAVINADPQALHQATETGEFVPINSTDRDARSQFLKWLVRDDFTPDDILDKMRLKRFKCYYIPHFVFTVDWAAGWSAESGHSYEVSYTDYETRHDKDGNSYKEPVTKSRTEIQWTPVSGQVGGHEEFAVMATKSRPPLAADIEKSCTGLWHRNQLEQLYLAPSPGAELCKPDLTQRSAYNELASCVIDSCASSEVYDAIPGERHRNERWSLTRQDHTATRVFIPVWRACYTYGDTEYAYCAPAWASPPSPMAGGTPDDTHQRDAFRAYYAKYEELKVNYTWGTIALVVVAAVDLGLSLYNYDAYKVLCIIGYVVAGAFALCAGIVCFTGMDKVTAEKATADNKKKTHLERSRETRRRSLAEHLVRLKEAV